MYACHGWTRNFNYVYNFLEMKFVSPYSIERTKKIIKEFLAINYDYQDLNVNKR